MDDDPEDDRNIGLLGGRDAGEDPEDPYEDTDISELPDWWRRTIEEFRQFGLRPYRPPRFEDGVFKHEIVNDLEQEYGVEIRFVAYASQIGDAWEVQVDGEPVGEIERRRSPEGYTVYGMESDAFADFVESKL